MYFIVRKTTREREADLQESRRGDQRIEGRVRTSEEAMEVSEKRERQGMSFDKPYRVSADAPESRQARIEIAERMGSKDPERDEKYVI